MSASWYTALENTKRYQTLTQEHDNFQQLGCSFKCQQNNPRRCFTQDAIHSKRVLCAHHHWKVSKDIGIVAAEMQLTLQGSPVLSALHSAWFPDLLSQSDHHPPTAVNPVWTKERRGEKKDLKHVLPLFFVFFQSYPKLCTLVLQKYTCIWSTAMEIFHSN